MAKFKIKVDLSGVKNFFIAKGERLALGLTSGFALLFIAMGLLGSRTAPGGVSWFEALSQNTSTLKARMANAKEEKGDEPPNEKDFIWPPYRSAFAQGPFFNPVSSVESKRNNPVVLPVLQEPMQIDYLLGGIQAYDIDRGDESAYVFKDKNADGKVAIIVRPKRMMIVHAIFPMKAQVREFQDALRALSQEDLLKDPQNFPRILGLNIWRHELKADGDWSKGTPLYFHDPKLFRTDPIMDKTIDPMYRIGLHPDLDLFFREALFDEGTLPPTVAGLVTPLPLLAYGNLPKVELPGMQMPEDPKNPSPLVKQPMGSGTKGNFSFLQPKQPPLGVGAVATDDMPQLSKVSWKSTKDKDVFDKKDKFYGLTYPFEPAGNFPERLDPTKGGVTTPVGPMPIPMTGVRPMTGGIPMIPMPGVPPTAGKDIDIPNLLVRFIDVDLQPGKTYRYSIQVRMANPNFGNKDVLHQKLAEMKELVPSQIVYTPSKKLPEEFYFYAADETPKSRFANKGKDPNYVAMQLQRWYPGDKYKAVADWVVAERLLVRRGDYIGRDSIPVEAPVWNTTKQQFVLYQGFNAKTKQPTGLPVQFYDKAPPLLVDFEGGHKLNYKARSSSPPITEESAVDLLVLTGDGKLTVHNSRNDTFEDSDIGKARLERYHHWWQRVHELHPAKK